MVCGFSGFSEKGEGFARAFKVSTNSANNYYVLHQAKDGCK
jgi:hypothetical protein